MENILKSIRPSLSPLTSIFLSLTTPSPSPVNQILCRIPITTSSTELLLLAHPYPHSSSGSIASSSSAIVMSSSSMLHFDSFLGPHHYFIHQEDIPLIFLVQVDAYVPLSDVFLLRLSLFLPIC